MPEPARRTPRASLEAWVDWAFFIFGGAAAIWFAALLLDESLVVRRWWFLILFWAALAYLVLPRIHQILTRIYLPDYFMGRTRTSDGLFGDPVNLALNGQSGQVHAAMRSAGWTMADPVDLASSRRIVTDTLLRRSYDAAPVSPLMLFERQQDFAYQQEVDGNPGKRHHIRFWKCPAGWKLPGGIAVDWLAAASYDRAVGLSYFTFQATHRISADIDGERDHVVKSVLGASEGASVSVIRDFSTGYHSRNGGGDTIRTDGNLPVLDLTRLKPVPVASGSHARHRLGRPAPVIVGAVLVLLRVLAALAVAGLLFTGSAERTWVADFAGSDRELFNSAEVYVPAGVALLAFSLFECTLAFLILRGTNWARLTAMSLSSVSIILQVAAFFAGQAAEVPQSDRPAYALDVLILLALSSDRARIFSHARRESRNRRPRGDRRFLRFRGGQKPPGER
ncbi:MAG: LssY C-terminal domain-containing protein [Arthrobacter sp.]